MINRILLLLSVSLFIVNVVTPQTYLLNSANNGQTYVTCDAVLHDEGGPGTGSYYTNNTDYEITFQTSGSGCIRAVIDEYDIEEAYDYLYFYDGPSSTSPQISSRVTGYPQVNGSNRNETGNAYYAQSGYITIRFTSDVSTVREGFTLRIDCPENCMAPSCLGTTPAGEYCNQSVPICDFNGYCGNTSSSYPTDHEEIEDTSFGGSGIFCGGINNNSWLSFVADSTTAILDVWVSNCQSGTGIQLQVYETDCNYNNFTPMSNCWSPAKEINGQITATGLTVGNTYLLMIDGFASDNCEYTFSASSGVIVADAGSDEAICEGEAVFLTASGGSTVVWSANPADPGLTGQETNMTINVSPSETTTYTATVSGSNPNCPGIADAVVFVNAADASFVGLDAQYCENGTAVVLTGNYAGGVFSGSGVSGSSFDPGTVAPGNYDITYSYNYSVVTTFSDDFDPWPDAGWIHGANYGTSSWTHGVPMGGDGQNSNIYSNGDPVTDHSSNTDNKVWGQGLSSSDGDGLGGHYDSSEEWLKSPAIDCSALSNTVVSFWRYANFETNWDEACVDISTDGTNYTTLTSEPAYPQDDEWTQRIINISSIADGEPTVYIRFRSVSDNLQTYSGWNIDDFSVTGVQAGGSCVSMDIQTSTVEALPVVNAGNNASICSNEIYTLNGSVSGSISTGSWSTSGSGSFDNSTSMTAIYTPSVADITAGSVTLTLTSNDPTGPCGPNSDNMMLTITQLDDAGFSYSSGTFCSTGSDPTPTVNLGGGTFSSVPAGLVLNVSTGEVDLSASAAQTYTITYTTNGTCPNSSNVSFTITSGFDAEFSYAGPFCEGTTNPLPVHATGSDGIYSASPAGMSFVNTSTGEIDLSSTLPGTYTVTNTIAASGGCAGATHNTSVQIMQAPTCHAGNDALICEGDIYTLSGSSGGGATSVNWTGGDGTFGNPMSPTSTYTPGSSDITTGYVMLTITTNDPGVPCSADSDQMVLTINQAATANAGSDVTICESDTYQITGASIGGAATSYSWTGSGDGVFNDSTAIDPVYTPGNNDIAGGSVILTITTDDPDGTGPCTATSDDMQITIDPAPQVNAGPDTSICEGDSYIVTGASMGAGVNTISWSTSGDGAFSLTNILNPEYTPGPVDISNGNIILTISSDDPAGPCDAAQDSMLLKINLTPELELTVDSSNCNQSDGSITVTPIGGVAPYNYNWSNGATDSTMTGLPVGVYSVTVIDYLGCLSDTTAQVFDIGAGVVMVDSTIHVLCHGDSTGNIYTSMSGGTPGYNYLWSSGETTEDLTGVPSGSYTLTVTDINNCIAITGATITEPPSALGASVSSTDILCHGDGNGTISVVSVGGTTPYNYLWSSGQTDSVLIDLQQGNYSFTLTDGNNCEMISVVSINEPTAISASYEVEDPYCAGSTDGVISILANGGTGILNYDWGSDISSTDTIVTGLTNGEYVLTITDELGCSASFTVLLVAKESFCLLIPNLFTPNNDSYNDYWEIKGVEYYSEIGIEVYNRWGDKVYSFDGSGTEYAGEPWKGDYNGNPLPMGSYVYIIDLKNGEEPLNGVVSLKR